MTEVKAWFRVWSKDDKLEGALFGPKTCAGTVRQGSTVRHAQLESQASRSVSSQLLIVRAFPIVTEMDFFSPTTYREEDTGLKVT